MPLSTEFFIGALLGLSRVGKQSGESFQPEEHQLRQFSRDTKDTPRDQQPEINFPNINFFIRGKCFSFDKNQQPITFMILGI